MCWTIINIQICFIYLSQISVNYCDWILELERCTETQIFEYMRALGSELSIYNQSTYYEKTSSL